MQEEYDADAVTIVVKLSMLHRVFTSAVRRASLHSSRFGRRALTFNHHDLSHIEWGPMHIE